MLAIMRRLRAGEGWSAEVRCYYSQTPHAQRPRERAKRVVRRGATAWEALAKVLQVVVRRGGYVDHWYDW